MALWPSSTSRAVSPQSMSWAHLAPQNPWFLQQKHQQSSMGQNIIAGLSMLKTLWDLNWFSLMSASGMQGHKLLGWPGCRTGSQENKKCLESRFWLDTGLWNSYQVDQALPQLVPLPRVLRGQCLQPHGGGTWCWRWIKAPSLRQSGYQQRPTAQGS